MFIERSRFRKLRAVPAFIHLKLQRSSPHSSRGLSGRWLKSLYRSPIEVGVYRRYLDPTSAIPLTLK